MSYRTDDDISVSDILEYQIEEGPTATSYEPYFSSNKMLAEENTQQSTEMMDIKMLGWSVPRECPVQNEVNGNQFVQKVGRVDAGNLSWEYIQSFTAFRFYRLNEEYLNYGIKQNTKLYLDGFNYIGVLNIWAEIQYADEKSIACVWAGGNDDGFIIKSTTYTDATSFKTAMQGKYLYYELETPITTTIDGNEIGETVSDVRKETTVNLLEPTLQSTTKNGITCTNNGDGTYTISGTSTAQVTFPLAVNVKVPTSCILTGCKGGSPTTYMFGVFDGTNYFEVYDIDNAKEIEAKTYRYAYIVVRTGVTIPDNTIIKPMLTTNLNATYDDCVPFTGDSGSLNGDVANIVSRLNNIYFEGTATFTKNNVPQNVIPIQSEGLYFITGTTNRSSTMVSAALWYAVKVPSGYGTIKIAETNYEYELSNTVMNYITVMAKSSTIPTESNPLIVNIKVIKLA